MLMITDYFYWKFQGLLFSISTKTLNAFLKRPLKATMDIFIIIALCRSPLKGAILEKMDCSCRSNFLSLLQGPLRMRKMSRNLNLHLYSSCTLIRLFNFCFDVFFMVAVLDLVSSAYKKHALVNLIWLLIITIFSSIIILCSN